MGLVVDDAKLLLRLRHGEKRFAYAVVNAINDTAKLIQRAEVEAVLEEFTVRKPDFIKRQAAIIKPFASVGGNRPFAVVSVGQKPRLFLSKFEKGGDRLPFKGKNVAIPVTGSVARPTFSSPVPDALTFQRLQFRKLRKGKRNKSARTIYLGEQQTFLIPGEGVFQREGDKLRLIYAFKRRVVLKPTLGFVKRAQDVTRRWFPKFLHQQVQETLARHG